ncbi:MAG: DUF488 domain-containing protein [Bradyrhizobiaceae bacterium]|nr:DUF488 domain-containing protein [Bradyrhizobiaceae bacterium]
MKQRIRTKRVYESPSPDDGVRILVDRIWPRGVSKTDAVLDFWIKDVAPSAELRKWFGHKPERWSEFRKRYVRELDRNPQAVAELRKLLKGGAITLLYAAQDMERNNAEALRRYLAARRQHKARQLH